MSNQAHSFIGNLTRDPELRTVNGKNGTVSVVHFTVAVDGRTKEEVVYFECEAWAQAAELIAKHFKKGGPIVINDAEAKNDTWDDKTTGEKRSKLKFRVNRVGFAPFNSKNGQDATTEEAETQEETPAAPTPAKKEPKPKPRPKPEPEPEADDDDIPF